MIRFLICVTILPMLMGLSMMKIKKERGTGSLRECYIMGLLFLLLLGEAASCAVIKLDGSFSFYCSLFAGLTAAGLLLSVLIGCRTALELWQGACAHAAELKRLYREPKAFCILLLAIIVLILLPIAGYLIYVPATAQNTMAETISVTLASDTVFQYDPVTGKALEYGMYPIYKLACLPLIYSAVCRLTGLAVPVLLYHAVPIWLLLTAVLILSLWGEALFEGNREKRNVFLLLAGVLLVTGDGETNTLAYGLLHGGFWGETAAAAIAVPFGAYMLYRFFENKGRLYCIFGILLSACAVLVMRPLFLPEAFAYVAGDSGREWTLLALLVFALYLARERMRKRWKKQEAVFLGVCLLLGLITGGIFPLLGTAYVGTCLWSAAADQKTLPMLIGLVLLFCFSGTVLPFRGECLKKTDVPQGDVEILDRIEELAEEYDHAAMLVAPENVMEGARLHCSSVILPYGKNLWYENCNREIADVYTDQELLLAEQMKTDYAQPDAIAAMAAEMHCDILVMRAEMSEEAALRGGWQQMEGATGYALYCK